MLTITSLSKNYGGQVLFEGVSLQFNPGNRYGIVGANGSGKSTFLRILHGEEEPSEGQVALPRAATVGVLGQDHFIYEDVPILDVVMMGNEALWDAIQQKEAILARAHEHFDADRYAVVEDIIVQNDGYALESRAAEILAGLNIPTEVHRENLSVLSGGFKLRVLLAQTLAANPDVLMLDEPTNHLDILSIRWLEKFLVASPATVVVISHDHRFLDNICTYVLDVDYQRITQYKGDYSSFVTQKSESRTRQEQEIDKREKEIADHQKFIRRFKAKATKARQAQSRVKRMEKIVIERLAPSSRRAPAFRFKQVRPPGKKVLEVEALSKAYDDNLVLLDVGFTVARQDRLAVIGPNGIGKSTLLKIIVDKLDADEGTVAWGHETYPGYFAQEHGGFVERAGRTTLKEWLYTLCPQESVGFVHGKLAEMLFDRDDIDKKIANLSGGELTRLVFAGMAVKQPNVMVLDEPTNHLDLEGIEALARALEAYEGTVIFVSHNRWFVSAVATRILEITPTGIEDFKGSYEEYLERCGDDHLDADAVVRRARELKRAQKASRGA